MVRGNEAALGNFGGGALRPTGMNVSDRPEGPVPITFEEFAEVLCAYFDRSDVEVNDSTSLADELSFDSIMYFELLLMLEELAGGEELPAELLESLNTAGDAYHYYVTFATRPGRSDLFG